MRADNVRIRAVTADDLERLADFRCSSGDPWEDLVELQIQGPLPRRYLAAPPRFDGRMLLGEGAKGDLLVVGAHHIEPTLEPNVGYVEVIAVSSNARGQLVTLPDREISLGELMLFAVFKQMRTLGRHPRVFARVDRRNRRSLALCDRAGLRDEYADPHDDSLVQRWGELPT